MKKAWKIVGTAAGICLVLGILTICVGFFTGASPSAIQSHGELQEYFSRLSYNADTFLADLRAWLGV